MGITYAAARSMEKAAVWRGPGKFAELFDYRLVILGSMLPEIFGLVILISFGIELVYRRKLRRFITTGRIS
jgi:hypothetical protein